MLEIGGAMPTYRSRSWGRLHIATMTTRPVSICPAGVIQDASHHYSRGAAGSLIEVTSRLLAIAHASTFYPVFAKVEYSHSPRPGIFNHHQITA
jgi:hypothetical protein